MREAQGAAWNALAAHLAPGGLAAVDAWLPDATDLARYDGRLHLEYLRRDAERGLWVTKSAAAQHDGATGTITIIEDVTQREFQASVLNRQQALDRMLSGALATFCPPDKKIIHGMTDAALLPCRVLPLS